MSTVPVRILLAEDSEIQARLLLRDLETAGFRARHARDGALALAAALESPPDLVISDVVMPNMGGFELCARIRAEGAIRHVPVLLLTTMADPRDILHGLVAGADGYVVKPYRPEALIAEIRKALERGRHDDLSAATPIEFDYGGEHFTIRTRLHDVLRLLTSTYENAIHQNRELVEAQESTRIAQRELSDKLLELEASQRRYRNLLEGSYSGFYRIGEDRRFMEVNPALASMAGMTVDDLGAMASAAELFVDDSVFEELLRQQASDGGAQNFRARLGKADGQTATVLINGHRVEEEDGAAYYEGFVLDVTERDRVEAALVASEEHFRSIVQLVPDIIYRVDHEGNFLFLNNAISDLGYSATELLGRHFSIILAEGELERVSRDHVLPRLSGTDTGDADAPKLFDERRSGDRRTAGLELQLKHKETGARTAALLTPIDCEVSSAGMYVKSHSSDRLDFIGTVGAIRDITRRKQQQQEIEKLNRNLERKVEDRTRELHNINAQLERTLKELYGAEEQLIQSEKLSAIGTMVGGVAHEVNNPLMGALNYVQYAIEKVNDDKLGEILKKAEKSIQRATRVTSSMLGYIREGNPQLGPVSVGEALEAVTTLLDHELKKNKVRLDTTVPGDLPPARCTVTGLEQILVNLVGNAVAAMDGQADKHIAIESGADAATLWLTVADNGPGIPSDIRRRIFDPFFTTKPPGSGTGLGLAISQRLATSFGGTLVVSAPPAGGARFTLRVPRADL